MSGVVIAETLRRHLRNVVYVAFTIVLAVIAGFVGASDGSPRTWLGFISLIALLLGCQLMGPEFSSGTLQLILAKPVNRSIYLLSRYAGVVLSVWMVIALPFAVDSVCRANFVRGSIDWSVHFAGAIHVTVLVLWTCALLALFGTFVRSYFNVGLYFGLQIILSLLIGAVSVIVNGTSPRMAVVRDFLNGHPGVGRSLGAIVRNLFPDPPPTFGVDRAWVVMVVTNAVIALLLACLIFRNREVPYGAD